MKVKGKFNSTSVASIFNVDHVLSCKSIGYDIQIKIVDMLIELYGKGKFAYV